MYNQSMKSNNIGERIRKQRQSIGMSIKTLSAILNVDRSTIYRYEDGRVNDFSYKILLPLSIALKTSPGYLLGLEDPEYKYKDTGKDIEELFNQLNDENALKVKMYIIDLIELQKSKSQ